MASTDALSEAAEQVRFEQRTVRAVCHVRSRTAAHLGTADIGACYGQNVCRDTDGLAMIAPCNTAWVKAWLRAGVEKIEQHP